MNYSELAKFILDRVGGPENVAGLTHCATRLRFTLKDNAKAKTDELKAEVKIFDVIEKGGQYQVVIGNDVHDVYVELEKLGLGAKIDEVEDDGKRGLGKVVDTITGIFTPVLPAITAAGMLKALLALLVAFKVIGNTTTTYKIFDIMGDAVFYFIPFMLAASAAKKFRANPYLAMLLAGILLHPNFTALLNAAKAGEAVTFFGIPVTPTTYASSVIPIILGAWVMSYVERFAQKISPSAIKFFTVPLITALVTGTVLVLAVGPLGAFLGDGLSFVVNTLDQKVSWLIPLIIGALNPLLVMVGMHYSIIPIGISNLAQLHRDTIIGPGMMVSNIAHGGAAFAVALKTKNPQLRQLGISVGIPAVCGITEPAMYGVNLKLKRPMIAVMISGAIAGLLLGIFGVARFTAGSPGLLSLPGYIGTDGFQNIIIAVIGCALSFVLAFVITYIITPHSLLEEHFAMANEAEQTAIFDTAEDGNAPAKVETDEITVYSPVKGETVDLEKVDDSSFKNEILGRTFAFDAPNGEVYAPIDGTVTMVFNTKHALSLEGDNGLEILLHEGVDTIQLEGKGFEIFVKEGQRVGKGDLLMRFDKELIAKEGYATDLILIVTNSDEYELTPLAEAGTLTKAQPFIETRRKA